MDALLEATDPDEDFLVIHGDAPGADSLAGWWAEVRGAQNVRCPANWRLHGRKAGPMRNTAMLALNPDLVVAFPGGTGTADMVSKATARGIKLKRVAETQTGQLK